MGKAPAATAVDGQLCVVTGGGSGIGAALCRKFASLGAAKVVVADANMASAQQVAESLSGRGSAVQCDVTKEQDVCKLIEAAEALGPIGVFVCNAGIMGQIGGVEAANDAWQRVMDVNVTHLLYCTRHLVRRWQTQQGTPKQLVITASAAGLLTSLESLAYAVSKHAAVAFAEWCAITYQEIGVQVTCLCPQAVDTAMIPRDTSGKPLSSAANVDGILTSDYVATCVIEAMTAKRFLVLPHPSVLTYYRNKAENYERWLGGMRKLRARLLQARSGAGHTGEVGKQHRSTSQSPAASKL
mmetsp:Transcript_34264/g.80060  ORF Transcript_34264/g.80060 Transcript_34264/m.80060 type:complete len:298 (+) Transcript_34264:141-1034(+)